MSEVKVNTGRLSSNAQWRKFDYMTLKFYSEHEITFRPLHEDIMSKIIGIDLGTTNSVVAVMEGGEPVVITNPEGGRITPSVVAFTKTGERLVGQVAKRQAVTNPENTIFSIKRFMGRRFDEVGEEMKMVPYHVVPDGQRVTIQVEGQAKALTPPEISAMILQKLKQAAEEYLGQPVTKAVITVPAYFNDAQRQATKDAGQVAGLEVMRIVNEPTAAALAYGLDKKKEETIAVYDFGGGTFDISILEVGEGVVEVKATNGDTHLGGDNLDQRVIDWITTEFKKTEGIDLEQGSHGPAAPEGSCGESQDGALHRDGDRHQPAVHHRGPDRPQAPADEAHAGEVRAACRRSAAADRRTHQAGAVGRGRGPPKIDEVVLVGGSTRIPKVQQMVRDLFGKDPHKGVNPDEVVAVGAAVQAGVLAGDVKDLLLLDVTPLSLGIETMGGVMTTLIQRNTTIPTRKSEIFSTASDNQTSVEVHVLQGERSMARDNRPLGKFHLVGLPPAPRGVPQIEVTFDIDANGIVNVSAKDLGTGKEQKITITASSGLNKEEVDRMMKEAEAHAEEDKKRREEIETRNRADQSVYAAEAFLKESGDKLTAADKQAIEAATEALRKAIEANEAAGISRAMEELTAAQHKAAANLYQQASAPGAGAPGGDGGNASGPAGGAGGAGRGGNGDVIDAEVVDDKS